jgi:nucleoside-diphosphate-sugar epimerase
LQKIFLTGASGCVGHYVLQQLLAGSSAAFSETGNGYLRSPGYHVYAFVRDPKKLRWLPTREELQRSGSELTIIQGNLNQIEDHEELLSQMNGVIHLAAAWGDAEAAFQINVTKTLALFRLLSREHCQKILYFSTASLLDPDHQPLAVAGRSGTDYIRSKYEMLMRRQEVPLSDRLITLYPTLLFGGSSQHPYSHITAGIKDVIRWLTLVRFFSCEASFHFIHAEDIAQIVVYLLSQPITSQDLVLGNPSLSFNECVEQMCHFSKKRIFFRIPIGSRLINTLAFLWQVKLSEWDHYCLKHRHFVYHAVNSKTFGLSSQFLTLEQLLCAYSGS